VLMVPEFQRAARGAVRTRFLDAAVDEKLRDTTANGVPRGSAMWARASQQPAGPFPAYGGFPGLLNTS